ncbi:twin-arginine translocation signal domain-containing protein [Cognatishimia sp. SS12]|uniref:dioxygenase family protein n=1 Tax=Cognatishimia sp. SS12 TaxID=2979465 RepID=UPI00232A81C3|nr:twin-arginine translocation signal domain-containing protein [Cognatishimia sp. SS12]MDC0737461.1 twin-arginine translocation signal domain-containing protein [Cognatishimia sp. SS12]
MTARRNFLKLTAATGLMAATPAMAAVVTPKATEGPYYPKPGMRFDDIDNDLVKIASKVIEAGGEVIRLTGQVMTKDGTTIEGARVEIWQTDANGRYLHTGERSAQPRDAAFQGFGHDITGPDGRYSFRTIKPVAYPGRTPHIHVKAFVGRTELTTQFYLDDDAQNGADRIYSRMTPAEREAVTMRFSVVDGLPQATVDIVL